MVQFEFGDQERWSAEGGRESGVFSSIDKNWTDLDGSNPVRLREWTASDFSKIYVRFRPHLEKHAQKFLGNSSSVEDVVQDAFLYLMTALPELDSEVGVLRFLKWKIRLLCLDLIRAQTGHPGFTGSPLAESLPSSDPELSDSIERADDAAIVRLALAQLSPRHRQAIVATVFEEKTSQQVAEEMGLTENAFRQLLHRARRAFKIVFVGQAEAANMSVSEALKLAATRNRLRLISGGSLLVLLAVAIASPQSFRAPLPTSNQIQVAQPSVGTDASGPSGAEPAEPVTEVPTEPTPVVDSQPDPKPASGISEEVISPEPQAQPSIQPPTPSDDQPAEISLAVSQEDLFIVDSLTNGRSGAEFVATGGQVVFQPSDTLRVRVSHREFEDFTIELFLEFDQREFVAVPRRLEVFSEVDTLSRTVGHYLTFSDFILGDPNGSKMATENTPLRNSIGQIRLSALDGIVSSADFKLLANF